MTASSSRASHLSNLGVQRDSSPYLPGEEGGGGGVDTQAALAVDASPWRSMPTQGSCEALHKHVGVDIAPEGPTRSPPASCWRFFWCVRTCTHTHTHTLPPPLR
jgi:hypothetical protein